MKKIIFNSLFFIVVTILSNFSYAQSCDTLRNYGTSDPLTVISSPTAGYFAGNLIYNDGVSNFNVEAWAERYVAPAATEVRGIVIGPSRVSDGGGSVTFNVYADASGSPGSIIGSEVVPLADLTPGQYNIIEFTTPTAVTSSFYVGYELSYTNPLDTFALYCINPASNDFTMFYANGTWMYTGAEYTIGGNPSQNAFLMDVLLSSDPTPVPSATFEDATACVGGVFNVDASSSTNALFYDWLLTSDPFSTPVYDQQEGETATLTTTQAGTNRVYIYATGSCQTRGGYYTVTVNPAISATVNTTDLTCGNDNGEIEVTGTSGGSAPYSYSLDGTNFSASNTFTGLSAGNYTVYVESDGNGCSETYSVTLSNTPQETITVGTDQTVCNGDNATLTASGNGTIEWFEGAASIGTGTSVVVSPTATTTYTAVLTDANGCEDQADITVTVNALPTVDAGTDFTVCEGDEITLSGSGADSYVWDNSAVDGTPFNISATTTFNVIGTDADGCEGTDQITVTVNPLDDPSFSYASGTLCSGGTNETPTVNATGTFTVDSPDLVFANTATGEIDMTSSLNGVYQITFTTDGTCSSSQTNTLTITSSPDAVFTYAETEYCQSESNPSPVFLTGASAGAFSVDITGLAINTSTGVIDLANSLPGTYEVTNTIAATASCPMDQASFTVTISEAPTATISGGGDICSNGDAPITITLTGTGPWDLIASDGTNNFSQSSPISSVTQNISTPGTYTIVSVTDATGCTNAGTGSATINVFPDPVVNAGTDLTVCEGDEITLSGSGADSYVWTNGVQDGVPFIINNTTSYSVTGTDVNGCTDSDIVVVTVNPAPTVDAGSDFIVCPGAEITLSASGTDSYVWDNGVQDGVAFTITATTTYTVTGTDASGCEGTDQITVTAETPSVDAGADVSVCEGEEVTLSASGADTYVWDNGIQDGVSFTPTATTTYTVTGTDANGCEGTDQVTVSVNENPTVTLAAFEDVCDNAENPIVLTGGTPAGGTYSGTGVNAGSFDPSVAGEGTHTITYIYETPEGCTGVATETITVEDCPNVSVEENFINNLVVYPNPASGFVTVSLDNIQDAEISISLVTTDGKESILSNIKPMSSFNESLDISNFASGIYFMTFTSEKGNHVVKIIID